MSIAIFKKHKSPISTQVYLCDLLQIFLVPIYKNLNTLAVDLSKNRRLGVMHMFITEKLLF